MAKSWAEVQSSPEFQSLSFDDKEEARNQYFAQVVAPKVATPDISAVRAQFDDDTKPGVFSRAADIASTGIGAVSGLMTRDNGRERQAIIDRSNEVSQQERQRQITGGTAEQLARMAREEEAAKQARANAHSLGGDMATDVLTGTMKVPGAATSLADLLAGQVITGATPFRSAAEAAGRITGIQPGKWADAIENTPAVYSQETGAQKENVNEAWKDSGAEDLSVKLFDFAFGGKATLADLKDAWTKADLSYVANAYRENPRAALSTVMQSAPSMVAGGFVSRGLMGLAEKFGVKLSATAAGAVGEGAITAGQSTDQLLDNGVDPRRAAVAGGISGVITGVIGGASGKLATKLGLPDVDTVMAGGNKTARTLPDGTVVMESARRLPLYKSLPGAMVQEGFLEEGLQSPQEQFFQNWAEKKPLGEGVLRSGVEGVITGAGMAGGVHPFTSRDPSSISDTPATPPGPGSQEVSASDLLGRPEPAAPVTESDKALYTPKNLTALDRVDEIDRELDKLNSNDDGTPEHGAKLNELALERDNITASWPKSIAGAKTTFSTETGARLDAEYALMDAGELTTSHDESLRPVPTYPTELQPRERERHASEIQVQGIVQKLDPARLGESADVATGAPVVGADGLVESGNARTIALKRVYQANGQKALDYKQFLKDNADRFGILPEDVDAMEKPVLVRVRKTPVNRAEFARQANASTVARMSPSEQAKSDAASIDSLDDLNPDESGDFMSGTSRNFIRRFLAKLPGTEQAGLIDGAGALSQAGYTRVRNAVLAKAYGDSPVLLRMTESLDDNTRNLSKALLKVAPAVAKVRESIAEGALYDADLTPDLVSAVEHLSDLRDKGVSIEQDLAQSGMFGDKLSPEGRTLLSFLNENQRSPRRIADFVQAYMDALASAGNPAQTSMFGDQAAPTKVDLLAAARKATYVEQDQAANGGSPTPNEAGRGQSADPAGDQAGNVRNEASGTGAAGSAQSEWVSFPPESGTLGIPRADMPQVKGDHRGALVNFLDARGIANKTEEVEALSLRPTQAEFSTKKAATWKDAREGSDRSVLASSDGYILDGHHQWVWAIASKEPVKVIRFNAPIKDLLAAVREFPSVKRSEGATVQQVATQAKQDFKEAMNDLALLVSKHTRAAMIPENTPRLHSILVRLFESAIKLGNKTVRNAINFVKERLKGDSRFKTVWNKILPESYSKAARAALVNEDNWEERRKGNYKAPSVAEIVPADVYKRVAALVEKWKDNLPEAVISAEDRIKAEAMLEPVIAAAKKDEPYFDERVKKAAAEAGIGYQLGPTKKIGRTAIKLVEEKFNLNEMKDIVRATVVVNSYSNAQAVVDSIGKQFKIKQINNKSTQKIAAIDGVRIKDKGVSPEGYSDVSVFVSLPGGGIAEIQINTPEMLSAKDAAHVLYEGSRVVEKDPERQGEYADLKDGQLDVYQAALASLAQRLASETDRKKYASSELHPLETGSPLSGTSSTLSSSNRNHLPSGNLTNSSPPNEDMNAHFSGNLSGTFISSTSKQNIAQKQGDAYTTGSGLTGKEGQNEHGKASPGGTQGKEPGAAQGTGAGGDVAGVRGGEGRGDIGRGRNADNGTGAEAGVQASQEPAGSGGDPQGVRSDGEGNSVRGNAGIPTGRFRAERQLQDSLAALAEIFRNHPGTFRIRPEDSPNLMPTLVKLFEAGIAKVGYDIKELMAYVKNALKSIAEFKTDRNKIEQATYLKAARQAIANTEAAGGDLFSMPAAPAAPDLFNQPIKTPKVEKPTEKAPEKAPESKPKKEGKPRGTPASQDIPPKTGRNYAFGDSDLTYEGSWPVKARQNVEAVELLKKLQAEGRQATRDEQAILAKFIGWGSSEMANSIFGKKLDKQLETLALYNNAIGYFDGRDYLSSRDRGFYAAFEVLKSKNPDLDKWSVDRITKAELLRVKPDSSVIKWGDLRDRLKDALTEEEWDAASRSTQYAHYTSKPIVNPMLAAISKMGFKGGSILEPGAGIGVFPGLMPSDMAMNSVYTGIEFEPITGGILKQLFPDERILVESFVDSKLPENFYDIAFGNPPFKKDPVLADPKYAKLALSLHDYFFAKTIDSVKPGGLVVFVTSRYTMDKKSDKARSYMAERADLVGAVRLPQTAFKKNAGTEVITDVLFLRKKIPGETFDKAQPWGNSAPMKVGGSAFSINEYFHAHPEMVLGAHSDTGKQQNTSDPQYTVIPNDGDIEAQFAAAAENLPADVFVAGRGSAAEAARVRDMDFNPKAKKEGSFYVTDAGVLMQRDGGVGVRVDGKRLKNEAVIKDYIVLRDAVKQSQFDQLNDGDWEKSLAALQKAYTAFVKKNGRILQNTAYMQRVKVDEIDDEGNETGNRIWDEEQRRKFPLRSKIDDDPEWTLVAALEVVNDDTGEVNESPWLIQRTLGAPAAADIKTPTDALMATLDASGKVDIEAIAEKIGLSEAETIDSLGSLIYEDPGQGWVMADEYLSGNTKKKLAQAEEAAKSDKRYARNVEALKEAQPKPIASGDITPQIGMNWIPAEIYEQFLREISGVRAKIQYVERTHEWDIEVEGGYTSPQATSDWGVSVKQHAGWIMEKALTGAPIKIMKSVSDGKGESIQVADKDTTQAAMKKRAEMRNRFRSWLWEDAKRTESLVNLYNDKFNTTVQRSFDGRHLTLPGTSKLFNIFDHVKRGAWRVIQTGNTYLAHAVGSGKTFEAVISAMEQKRLGKIKKPMIIVPGHMLQQFATEWQQLYPTAKLMVADEKDFHTDNRRRFVSRVAMSDLDGVIMTHSSFKLLDLDPEFKKKMIEQELEFLRASYEEAGGNIDDIGDKKTRKDPKIKRIEAQIESLEQELAKAMSSEGKDKNVRFDEMGVDYLYVDEAHLFRKLSYATNRQMKGIDPKGSKMAWDLFMKTRWLKEKNPTRYLTLMSGTPITNTTAELYTVQRYLAPQVLEERNIQSFDDWASQFGEETETIEATSSGKYEPVTRFQRFINLGELTQMFRDFADVLTEDHLAALLGDKRPKVVGGARKSIITPKTETYKAFQEQDLVPRIERSKKWKPSFEEQNNPDPIININTDARLAAIDMRFMDPTLQNDPNSKLNHLIDGVIRVYKETASNEYKDKQGNVESIKGSTQMVFFESGFGRQVAINRGFNARAWMEKRLRDAGIPPSQVAFMEDYKKSSAKLKLFKEVNSGKVRVLVGSSGAMGTGVNAQQRLIALHHLDAPMVPAILEQREGRIVRQGNKNPMVQIYAYAMKGSFDEQQWGMLARKRFFIEQAMSGDPNIRSIEDVGEVNQMEQAAGLIADNPYVGQLAGVKGEIEQLSRLYRNHEENRARFKDDYDSAGRAIAINEKRMPEVQKDAGRVKDLSADNFEGKADGQTWNKRKDWGVALMGKFKELADRLTDGQVKIGEISGFDVVYQGLTNGEGKVTSGNVFLVLPEPALLAGEPTVDPIGVSVRAVNALVALARRPADMQRVINEATAKRESLVTRLDAPFPLAEQLSNKIREAAEVEKLMLEYGKEQEAKPEDPQAKLSPMEGLPTGSKEGKLRYDRQAQEDVELLTHILTKGKDTPAGSLRPVFLRDDADLQIIAGAFGKRVVGVRVTEKRGTPEVLTGWQGATIGGGKPTLFLREDAKRPHFAIIGHELVHQLRKDNPKLYTEFADAVRPFVRAGEYGTGFSERFGTKNAPDLREEFLGEVVSDGFMSDSFWKSLGDANPTLLGKVFKIARALMQKAAQALGYRYKTSNYLTDFDAVMKIAGRVMAQYDGKRADSAMFGQVQRLADRSLSSDLADQEKWLEREAKARGYKTIDELVDRNYPLFEKLALLWRNKHPVEGVMFLPNAADKTPAERAEDIIQQKSGTPRPLDWFTRAPIQAVRLDKATTAAYNTAGTLIDRLTPEMVKAGLVSNYGIPEAVIDQRAMTEGKQRGQIRAAGALLDKLSTLTRAESRVAYEWMNSADPQSADYFADQLPPESIRVLAEVEKMIDGLSKEAVKLGQLDPESFKKNRFAYLRRSYVKHTAELTKGEAGSRARAISILGEQYKGRGMTDAVDIAKVKNVAPEWWKRKTQAGKADKGLKGEKFTRLERRAPVGQGVASLPGMPAGGVKPRLLEVAYWPAGEAIPARYGSWEQVGTWEVRDTKGANLVLWRDFSKQERVALGEIDEARYAIAKTLHGMIHDVETGKYLEWLAQNYAKKEGEQIDGTVVEASERMRDTYKIGEWVKVPDTTITGTKVKKYGTLAGRYLPGPIWNDVRQSVGFRYAPLGEVYASILRAWKMSKTSLSPAVHMNNVMANFVMADWHDISAGHILKALKLMASKDAAAAEILNRFGDSGGTIGTWATKELQQEQLRPLLEALEKELGIAGNVTGQVGVMSALQLMLKGRLPSAWDAFKPSKPGQVSTKVVQSMLNLYEAEDQVFRLAAWLKAKEDGATDREAGKVARKSFLDYSINAPWVQMMRSTALPFVSFTYRAVPMLLETAAKKPWKILKLGMLAGAINALGYMLSGGDEDDERKLLPEEKAGRVWGIVPKLVRMPWNDDNGSPVFLDIRRFIPVGDMIDTGQSNAAIPMLPSMVPGGPLAVLAELAINKAQFTGKDITLETDTGMEKAQKVVDHVYKAFMPNVAVLPGTYAWTGIVNAGSGKTDSFGREQSLTQAMVSSVGIKLGSYPKEVLMLNAQREAQFKDMEIQRNITGLKREYAKKGITAEQFQEKATVQMEKRKKVAEDLQKRASGAR